MLIYLRLCWFSIKVFVQKYQALHFIKLNVYMCMRLYGNATKMLPNIWEAWHRAFNLGSLHRVKQVFCFFNSSILDILTICKWYASHVEFKPQSKHWNCQHFWHKKERNSQVKYYLSWWKNYTFHTYRKWRWQSKTKFSAWILRLTITFQLETLQ